MLVITRKNRERLFIGRDIEVNVLKVRGNRVQLGILAPVDVPVCRDELHKAVIDCSASSRNNRHRQYAPHLGRFLSWDPFGYSDGVSLYRAYFAPGGLDPFGNINVGYVGPPFYKPPKPPPVSTPAHLEAGYTIGGLFVGLRPVEEYAYYHCFSKCECSMRAARRIVDTSVEAVTIIRSLTFDPNQHPGVFDIPWDFQSREQVAAGEPLPAFPAQLHYNGRAHSALRHCIWSGLMARALVDCDCAACITDSREMFQYYYGESGTPQPVPPTHQALYNNREGRSCAGCLGNYADSVPGESAGYPFLPGRSNVTQCCVAKLLNKQLATNIVTPGAMPSLPPRPGPGTRPPNPDPDFQWPGVR